MVQGSDCLWGPGLAELSLPQGKAAPPGSLLLPGWPLPGTTIVPAVKVTFETAAWPLTVGGLCAGHSLIRLCPSLGPTCPLHGCRLGGGASSEPCRSGPKATR